jgi:hypothetical protein
LDSALTHLCFSGHSAIGMYTLTCVCVPRLCHCEQAGESTGCEVQVEWQGDHKIFGHEDYKLASRTYADVITNGVRVSLRYSELELIRILPSLE